jgi:hypothetical protein
MRTATCHVVSIAPYSQSRAHEAPFLSGENADAYEQRTWKEKAHVTQDGFIFIPPAGAKLALTAGARMLGIKVPGKGRSTYTKFFESGVMCVDPIVLPVKKDDVACERIHAHSNGRRGSGSRVWRYFPIINAWEADMIFHLLADEITEPVFEQVIKQTGSFIGIGRFRPENQGSFGRFRVESIQWTTG